MGRLIGARADSERLEAGGALFNLAGATDRAAADPEPCGMASGALENGGLEPFAPASFVRGSAEREPPGAALGNDAGADFPSERDIIAAGMRNSFRVCGCPLLV